ncbi:HAD family hydrolase [Parapedobacter sp. ISTM3]|uniref:Putative hydrolase of the HAD superfamily n=1 Tax=Parapedobacter luteus TaxID=623280 RepID=A0A1T5BIN6_9SPHI|nr:MULTISPECIES: HAD family hydrolase [Parapedobacter]MBK1439482.1 HAD family hydrolase [Parapedobacter sp. ISTM3]SKB46937.1 putative hydrolase of the HAD superfamily [Parapedobacter luteus]
MQTRGILLNYEGTIDTNGQHWGAILWHKFQKHIIGLDKSVFNRAYTYSEQVLASEDVIKPSHIFLDVLVHKITQQFDYLTAQGYQLDYNNVQTIAKECNNLALRTLRGTKRILERLSSTFPIVLVSNFYGNLNAVLTEFGIKQYFADVVESSTSAMHFNTEIYEKGVSRLGYSPEECVAVGDSYNRDILPSKAVGCKTIWLNVMGWEEWGIDELEISDAEIGDFGQLPALLERWQPQQPAIRGLA